MGKMRTRIGVVLLVCMMLLCVLPISALADDKPFNVDGTGYDTIQEAVAALKDSSVMTIAAGTYDVTTTRTSKETYGTCFVIDEDNVTIKAADSENKPVIYGFSNEFNAGVDGDGINGQDTIYVSGKNVTLENLVIMPLGGIGENANNWQKTVEVTADATGFRMTGCETQPNTNTKDGAANSMKDAAGNIHVSINDAEISGNSFGAGTTVSAGWVDGVSASNTYTVDVSGNYWGADVTAAELAEKIDGNVVIDSYYTDEALTESVEVGGIPVANATQLQNAVTSAKAGDTIVLAAGTYELSDTLKITKRVNLVGAGADQTTIKGAVQYMFSESQNGEDVTVSGLTIEATEADKVQGLQFRGDKPNSGYDVDLFVSDCKFTGWTFGITMNSHANGYDLTVSDCTFATTYAVSYNYDDQTQDQMAVNSLTLQGNNVFEDGAFAVQVFNNVPATEEEYSDKYYPTFEDFAAGENAVEGPISYVKTSDELIAAIEKAKDGDTIVLAPGTFELADNTCITLNKQLTIQGSGEDTIIKGFGSTDYGNGLFTFVAGSEGTVLKDLTIKYTASGAQRAAVMFYYGFAGNENNVTKIQNVDFIGADSLDEIMDEKAMAISSVYGGAAYIEISDCSFTNFAYGMYFNSVQNLTVVNNSFDGTKYNAINIAGDSEEYPCANIVIQENELTNISYANYEDDAYSSGIRIGVNSKGITVEDNEISMLHDKQGVYFDPVEGSEFVAVTMVSDGEIVGFYKLTAGENFVVPAAPEKAGFTFLGWKYGDKIAKAGDTVTISESTEFVAQWEEILVTGITLDKTSLTLVKGASETVTATVEPANAADIKVSWSTSNDEVATVEDGKITAVGCGTATITAKIGDVFATCVVNVICDDESCVYYDDLSDDNPWYHPAVDFVTEQGIMQGIAEKTFAPEMELTRAQFAQILYNMEGKPEYETDKTFDDVQEKEDGEDVWYYDAVMWAASTGVVKGYEDDCYYPDKDITRQEMVTMLHRYAEYKKTLTGEITEDLEAFPDSDEDSVWDKEAFAWAVQHGIVNGKDGELAAGDSARRCEIAKIIMVYMSLV